MLIEEYGRRIDSGAVLRNLAFQAWLDQVVECHGAGALVWMIASTKPDGQQYPDYDHYTVYAAEDVPSVCAFARSTAPANSAKT